MNDLIAFPIGVGIGAALAGFWLRDQFKRFVVNCGKVAGCPHHSPANAKRLNDTNDRTRNGPNRPDIK